MILGLDKLLFKLGVNTMIFVMERFSTRNTNFSLHVKYQLAMKTINMYIRKEANMRVDNCDLNMSNYSRGWGMDDTVDRKSYVTIKIN